MFARRTDAANVGDRGSISELEYKYKCLLYLFLLIMRDLAAGILCENTNRN